MAADPHISEREREILRLIATGATNQRIANDLTISVNTVKVHVRNIFAKIDVASRAEATLYAVRAGLVRPEEVPGAEPLGAAGAAPERAAERRAPAPPPAPLPRGVGEGSAVSADTPTPGPTGPGVAPSGRAGAGPAAGPRRLARRPLPLALAAAALVAASLALWQALGPALAPRPSGPPPTAVGQADQRWRELPPLPSGRAAFGLASYAYEGRTYLYALAGDAGGAVTGQVLRFDPVAGVWVPLSPKPTPVADVRAAVVGGRVYVPGGRLASGAISSVLEAYDPQRDRWSALAPLPAPRSGYALAAVEGKLYVIGGWDGQAYRGEVWQYDPDDDLWRPRAAMPTPRAFAAVAVLDQAVHVVGGQGPAGALSVHERYAPALDEGAGAPWAVRAPAGEPIGHGDAAVAGGLLVAAGGDSAAGRLLIYSAQTDSWRSTEMPLGRLGDLRLQAVGNKLYIVGGRGDAGPSAAAFEYRAISTVFLPAIP